MKIAGNSIKDWFFVCAALGAGLLLLPFAVLYHTYYYVRERK